MKYKIEQLNEFIRSRGRVIVAYSGGVDSSLVLKLCADLLGSGNVIAVTAVSETYTDIELRNSEHFAEMIGVEHVVLNTKELANPDFKFNSPLRCYYCKRELFSKIAVFARKSGIRHIFDGSNADDLDDYRPGKKAAAEFGVESPLAQFGFSKEEVRKMAKSIEVPSWNKPSNPCLASRIPYGDEITEDKLRMVRLAEKTIRDKGFQNVRVRHHGKIARIEVPQNEIAELLGEPLKTHIINSLKNIGFTWVSVDMEGYRTGSLNEDHLIAKTKIGGE